MQTTKITETAWDWDVRAVYKENEGKTAEFTAPLSAVDHYFDNAELDGWTIEVDRKTGSIYASDPDSCESYIFNRKGRKRPITVPMIDQLVRLDKSANGGNLRIVRTRSDYVRLFGFCFGTTTPQATAIRDAGWVRIEDDIPRLTSIGRWIIDHAEELQRRIRKNKALRFSA